MGPLAAAAADRPSLDVENSTAGPKYNDQVKRNSRARRGRGFLSKTEQSSLGVMERWSEVLGHPMTFPIGARTSRPPV